MGVFAGISNYQGDLPSYSTRDGFKALIGPVIGVHGGYELNKTFQLRADLLYTRLSGDDALAEKEETMQRNLDFFAPVIQLAVGGDWNIVGFNSTEVGSFTPYLSCLLYTSDAADERSSVDLGGRRIIKKKKNTRSK